MKLTYLCGLLTLIAFSCGKPPQVVEAPCMTEKIEAFSSSVTCTSGASVIEYEFKGDWVYVFDHGNCIADHTQTVLNYDCDTIGYLGGLAGSTEIDGKNFYEKAEATRTLFSN